MTAGGFDLIRAAYAVDGLDEHERAVLVLLAFMANDHGEAWPSIAYIVGKTGKGERTIQRAIGRLVDGGHLSRRQRRHDTAVYRIHPAAQSRPVCGTGVSDTPVSLTPVSADVKTRPTDTQTAKNNQPICMERARAKRIVAATPVPPSLPPGASLEQWAGFVAMRTKIRKPLTDHAMKVALAALHKIAADGDDPGAALDRSTLNNWQGIFPSKGDDHEQRGSSHRRRAGAAGRGTATDAVLAAFDRVSLEG